jgi:hypothetical protein
MSIDRRSLTSNAARIATGVLALALLVALLATVFLSRGSIDDAEAQAQTRAVDWANTVLFDALTPEQVTEPILGPDYRELLITVQAGILSDDRAARVRIWNTGGELIFSDDQRDKIGEFVAQDNPQIEAALAGDTVSVPTDTSVAPKSGLAGSDERLFQTFVPLRLVNQLGVSGVVQIDQRYSVIEAAASDVWQTVRLSLVIALTLAVALFLFILLLDTFASGSHNIGWPVFSKMLRPEQPMYFYGFILFFYAWGNVAGIYGLNRMAWLSRLRPETLYLGFTAVMSMGMILIFQTRQPLFIALASFVAGVGDGTYQTYFTTYLQQVPDAVRGKIFALSGLAVRTGFSVGFLAVPLALQKLSVAAVAALFHGLVLAAVAVVFLLRPSKERSV